MAVDSRLSDTVTATTKRAPVEPTLSTLGRFEIKDKKTDFKQVAKWTVTIARALYYAHEMGIEHRDVKSHNVMLDGR
jgi:serine/threonine protein kinase